MAINWIYNRNPPYWRHVRVLLTTGEQRHAYLGDPRQCAGGWYDEDVKPLGAPVAAWVVDPVHEKRREIAEAERRLANARKELEKMVELYKDFA
ncbi:MAG: DNA-binding protein [Edwardsiella phage MSW-3]|uniref:Uncharacterized protein n=1 Tax=Edwardsiella phage MSW-3 TaxID=1264700 RepID=L0MXY6_9CAUD|nr:hypothetical protein G428_gp11 [Edwardsiella phage MSW-3]BAM68832.1 hypothetical protein [Edwardsiella phage MSW-3]BEU28741.1 MAG: DNA-binding protein [Edwardsiella phage MSW-3]